MPRKNNPDPKTTSKNARPPTTAAPQPLASAPTGHAPPPPVTQAQPVAAPPTPPLAHVANDNNMGTKLELQSSYAALMAGLSANYAPDAMFPLAQGDFTRDQLVAQFQQYAQAALATNAAYQAWRSAVQNERTIEASISPLREGVRNIVVAKLGKSSPQLTGYGFSPRKVAQPRALTKAAGQVKAEATRKARGTVGKKQKLAISGNVTGVTITPITSAPSTGSAAPATTATTATTVAPKS
jgi:predicted RNA-binding Zn ribbon-like protein